VERTDITLASLDGTKIAAHLYQPSTRLRATALMVHGIMSEKTESGLYESLAEKLGDLGIRSLSIDLRSHGESEGKQEDFSMSGAIADIQVASDYLDKADGPTVPRILIGASFGGGLILYASQRLVNADLIVLYNPRTTYRPWISTSSLFSSSGILDVQEQKNLTTRGYCTRRGFRIGKFLVNELWMWTDILVQENLPAPLLVIHGKADTTIPIEETRRTFAGRTEVSIVEVPEAQHGFTDVETDDPQSKKSREIRHSVIETTSDWLLRGLAP
jgi:uncharacterized protein